MSAELTAGSIPPIALRPRTPAPIVAAPRRAVLALIGNHLRGPLNRLIAASSIIPNDPVLDVRLFPWTQLFRDRWEEIRAEAVEVALCGHASPSDGGSAPDQHAMPQTTDSPSLGHSDHVYRVDENAARCPVTSGLARQVPGLSSAFFSLLAPGTHVPAHRGVSKGLVTCHLGLGVPRDGDARMRVGRRVVRWAEGETLVFDDTFEHEVWNDTDEICLVLLLEFDRPLRNPGKWIANLVRQTARRAAFAQERRRNLTA
ncbi:aspartyl/asparaginyl beta-hydroxylase domain-containing protein [Sphingomonas dokdonensis]|uniref:Aspartyl/asparaginyl beta-hydroxylase n=1 Tax=Sphingomonas dokdonensis TaxID=344880 RepID=A0A245ZVX6_9SPHN|nr:aspartyl/asparaginyl beta-hydroxylase domain-containing protein [Sphingomonas dokdonensis]OWK33862.1 aspartyl/asparaginyl beta-hydroxylase [Sphingomonas dokdonensis]